MKRFSSQGLAAALLISALLSGCGGGGSDPSSSSTTSGQNNGTPVTQASDESLARAASTEIVVNGTKIKATTWLPANLPSTGAHAIPATQQGAYIELEADATSMNWGNLSVTAVGQVQTSRVNVDTSKATSLSPSARSARRAYFFLANPAGQQYVSLKIQPTGGQAQWLRAATGNCACSHRILTNNGFSGGTNGPRLQAVFSSQYDYSAMSSTLRSMLYVRDGSTTETDVMEGMMTYGEKDKIIERRGFSFLDAKRYLLHLGLNAQGFRPSEKKDFADLVAMSDVGVLAFVTVDGYSEALWITGADEQYLYVASTYFGDLALSWSTFPNDVVMLSVSTGPLPTSTP